MRNNSKKTIEITLVDNGYVVEVNNRGEDYYSQIAEEKLVKLGDILYSGGENADVVSELRAVIEDKSDHSEPVRDKVFICNNIKELLECVAANMAKPL